MRKNFLVLIMSLIVLMFASSTAWGSVSLSAFHDPVVRKTLKYYDAGWVEFDSNGESYLTGNNDGILSDKEIEQIEYLNLYNLQIETLEGVKYLTSLKKLECGGNQLTKIDVSGCSSLQVLDCSSNPLTELNVKGCSSLEILNCGNCQLKEEVNLSGLSALKDVFLGDNQITSLDLNGCSSLESLLCGSNQLKELDLNGLSKLSLLNCQNNPLLKLNLKKCSALEELVCFNCQLAELDLSDCLALTDANANTFYQVRKDLKVKVTNEGFEVNLSDYVSKIENIEAESIKADSRNGLDPIHYNKSSGIAIFSEYPKSIYYEYQTHSPNNDIMDVTIKQPMGVAVLERGSEEDNYIISDMDDSSYMKNSSPITESDVVYISSANNGKNGFTADGNSRLILRVRTEKSGTVTFSLNDDINATLEQLTNRKNNSASKIQVRTTELQGDAFQASAVLIAPENFPSSKMKNFPSDTFKVHVKFVPDDPDEDSAETDIELKIEATPVVLVHGFGKDAKASNTFIDDKGNGIMPILKNSGFSVYTWDYDGKQGPSVVLANDDNDLSKKITEIFNEYNKEKIACTRVDLVGYSLGGLMVRYFCMSEANKKYISYGQGMARRVITVATPHRGSQWSEVYYKYPNLANTVMKYLYGDCPTAWEDMRPGSVITTSANFPKNIPMYSIYGMAKDSFNTVLTTFGVGLTALSPVITINLAALNPIAFYGGVYLQWRTVVLLNYVQNMFQGEEHDWCVSESSAQGDFSGHSVGFKAGGLDGLKYNHINICKQNKIGEEIAKLLKGSKDEFKTFSSSSSSFNSVASSKKKETISTTVTPNYSIDSPFEIMVVPEVLNIRNTGKAKIKIVSDVEIKNNLYMAISTGDVEKIFSVASKDAKTFEVSVEFTSQDAGTMEISCFSFNPNNPETSKLYVSDTAQLTVNFDAGAIDEPDDPKNEPPVITTTQLDNGTLKQNYEFQLEATGTSPIKWTSKKLPNGLKLSESGFLSGKLSKVGSNDFTVTATNDYGKDEKKLTLVVYEAPSITTAKLTTGNSDKNYNVTLKAKGSQPLEWKVIGLPEGLNFNSSKNTITGKTSLSGNFSVDISVSNPVGSDSKTFGLFIKGVAPKITANLKSGKAFQHYEAKFSATGTTPIIWSLDVVSGKLPDGISFDSVNAVLGGFPTETCKNVSLKLTASNNTKTVSKNLKLTIAGEAPKFVTTSLDKGIVGVKYNQKIVYTGTPTISLSEKGLPEGLTLDNDTITGKPKKDGKYSVTFTAENGVKKVTKKLTLNVFAAPEITTSELPNATLKKSYNFTLQATGTKPITWSLSGEIPDWLKFNKGKLSGKPKESGEFNLTVTAKNSYGETSRDFVLVVDEQSNSKTGLPDFSDEEIISTNNSKTEDESLDIDLKSDSSEVVIGNPRNAEDLTTQELKALEGYTIAAILPEIKVLESGQYDFEIKLDENIQSGAKLFWFAFPESKNSNDDNIAEFYNISGEEISAVPDEKIIIVSPWLNEGIIYRPVIAVKNIQEQ